MALRNLARAGAWLMLAAIVVLSLVPPAFRPTTPMPHHVEHLSAFFLDGLAWGVSFPGHERLLSLAAVAFCAGIELAQRMVLGRHARVSDFIVDAAAKRSAYTTVVPRSPWRDIAAERKRLAEGDPA
jgi:hypothetical protein